MGVAHQGNTDKCRHWRDRKLGLVPLYALQGHICLGNTKYIVSPRMHTI